MPYRDFEEITAQRMTRLAVIEAVDVLVRILQVVIPLAAAKQLGQLEGVVEERLRIGKLLRTMTS